MNSLEITQESANLLPKQKRSGRNKILRSLIHTIIGVEVSSVNSMYYAKNKGSQSAADALQFNRVRARYREAVFRIIAGGERPPGLRPVTPGTKPKRRDAPRQRREMGLASGEEGEVKLWKEYGVACSPSTVLRAPARARSTLGRYRGLWAAKPGGPPPPARILPPLRGCASSSITFFPPLPNLGSPLLALTFRVVHPAISVLAANSEWQTEERFESRLARKQHWWYAIGIAGSSARRPHLRRRSAESRRERSSLPKQSTTACVVKLSWGFKLVRQGYPSALSFRDSV